MISKQTGYDGRDLGCPVLSIKFPFDHELHHANWIYVMQLYLILIYCSNPFTFNNQKCLTSQKYGLLSHGITNLRLYSDT